MRRTPRSLILPIFLLAASASAAELELTPTVAYRFSDYGCTGSEVFVSGLIPSPFCTFVRADGEDAPAFGAVLGIGIRDRLQIEVLASRQESELAIDFLPPVEIFFSEADLDFTVTHLQVGVARSWGEGAVRPFAGVAAGASRVESEGNRQMSGFSEDALSASLGAGIKVLLSERFGVRLEARGYWVDLSSEVGGDFTQTEAAAGLIVRF